MAAGYRAGELGTSGDPASIELGLLAIFLVCAMVAVRMTLIRLRGKRARSRSRLRTCLGTWVEPSSVS